MTGDHDSEARSTTPEIERGAAAPGIWRYERASRARVIIDAQDYFAAIRDAMLNARHRILLIGWDFDTRIDIGRRRRRPGDPPRRLGDFLIWLADRRPDLHVHILKWNVGALKLLGRGSSMIDLARWALHDRIHFRLDGAHPVGCSHHQKVVVIDDRFAVCGGIDMTSDRWDTRAHRDEEPGRRRPNGKPHPPWHDATMLLEGDVATALGDMGRARWVLAGGEPIPAAPPEATSAWPEAVEAEYRDVTVGIARTRAAWEDQPELREVEELFLRLIARARRFIYAENQYFASRRIAEAIALRMREADPPEIVIVGPRNADGWLEQKAMDGARARLLTAIGEHDRHGRFGVFVPHTAGGEPIYVHAKLMIVDDEVIRVGSANMNNRSLGLDSECDAVIDAALPGNADAAERIRATRLSLLAEHCGVDDRAMAAALDAEGSMMRAIAALASVGAGDGRSLRRLELEPLSVVEEGIADAGVLDPERAHELFEPFASPGLLGRSRLLRAR